MARSAILGLAPGALGALVRRPDLWPVAVRVGRDMAPNRWWRQFPPLPLPDRKWMAFRLTTAYGGNNPAYGGNPTDGGGNPTDGGGPADSGSGRVSPREFVDYLEWCRDFPR